MGVKLNSLTELAKETEELPRPTNVRAIDMNAIAEKYAYQVNEKGMTGLSKFYDCIITDEWVEIEKPNKERLPEKQRHYLGLITVLCDKKTGEPIKKGCISLSKLVQPYAVYDGDNIRHVQQIVNIPAFGDSPDGQVEYARKHIVGKMLKSTDQTFKAIKPDFSMGTPSLYGMGGEKLQEKETAYFEAVEMEEDKAMEG